MIWYRTHICVVRLSDLDKSVHDDVIKWTHFRVTDPLCGDYTGHRWIPPRKPVTLNFYVFFDLRLNKRLSKQSSHRWFEAPSHSLWRFCHVHIRCMYSCIWPFKSVPLYPGMMTSSNGNIFRVTGPLCGEFTGPGEFPAQRPLTGSFGVFFDLRPNKRLSEQPWGW